MSKLKAFLPNLDGLDKALHAFYREEPDVGYVLDAEDADGWSVANVANATAGVAGARRERDAARKELAALKAEREKLAAERAQLEADLEAATEGKLDKKAIEEQVQKRLERAHQQALQGISAERDTHAKAFSDLESEFHRTMVERAIAEAASGGKWSFNPKVLGSHIAGRLRVAKGEDGKRSLEILDANGEPRVALNGKPPTIDDLLADYTRDGDFAQFITRRDQQPPRSGSDARPATGANRTGSGGIAVTPADLADFRRYEQIKAQAAKEGRELILPGA